MNKTALTTEEKKQKITDSFNELEKQRAVAMERTQKTQKNKQSALLREKKRLGLKYGPNHAKSSKIDRQIKSNPNLFKAFDEADARVATSVPDTVQTDWMLYGLARNARRQPIQGHTVSLFDKSGKWVKELGYACTDEKGHYFLKIPDTNGILARKYKDAELYLTMTNDDRKVLYQDTDPLFFTAGQAENRNIILAEDQCGTPPEEDAPPGQGDYVVEGTISDKDGKPLPGLKVRAVDLDFTGENRLGTETSTDLNGFYKISYKATDFIIAGKETTGADIVVYVSDQKGKEIHRSEVYRNSPKACRIDLAVDVSGKKR